MDKPKYSLHLFAGGGGILADILDNITPICAVEIEKYQQKILSSRFPKLPIWDNVCTFRSDNKECEGMFEDLRERRDELIIAGGFPCQDISCAGKGAGIRGGKDPMTANVGLLNPDWVEWLMGWPLRWTDIDCTAPFLLLELADDPAEWTPQLMARVTTKKTHRKNRIKTLGNGQVPLCAAVAFIFGMEILRVALEVKKNGEMK